MWIEVDKPKYEFKQHLRVGQTAYHQTENLRLAQLIRLTQGLKRYEDGSDWSGRRIVIWLAQGRGSLDERWWFRMTRVEDWLKANKW